MAYRMTTNRHGMYGGQVIYEDSVSQRREDLPQNSFTASGRQDSLHHHGGEHRQSIGPFPNFLNPPRYQPEEHVEVPYQSTRRDTRKQNELLELLTIPTSMFAHQHQQEPPDVYVGALPPTPSPINWEQRQWSLRQMFTYFCSEPCPPSKDMNTENQHSLQDVYMKNEKNSKNITETRSQTEDDSFMDPPRYRPDSSIDMDKKEENKWFKGLYDLLCFKLQSNSMESKFEFDHESEIDQKLQELLSLRDALCKDLAYIDLDIKERKIKILSCSSNTLTAPCLLDVLPNWVLRPLEHVYCSRQRGGGKKEESSSDTSSSSSDEPIAVDRILKLLKHKQKKMKKGLKNLNNDIAFVQKLKGSLKDKMTKVKVAKKITSEKEVLEKSEQDHLQMSSSQELKYEDEEDCFSIPEGFWDINFDEDTSKDKCVTPGVSPDDVNQNNPCDAEDTILFVGQLFKNFEFFETARMGYSRATFTIMTKHKSEKNYSSKLPLSEFPFKRIEYDCIHHGEIKPKSKDGSRPHQSYNSKGCTFKLIVNLNIKKRSYRITKLDPNHTGHTPTKRAFDQHKNQNRLTKDEKELFVGHYMEDLKLPSRKVKEQVLKKTGKHLSVKDLNRLVQTRRGEAGGHKEMDLLLQQLNVVQENDPEATVSIAYAESDEQQFVEAGKNIIKVIHIQTSAMKKRLKEHPSLILFDGTYNVCRFIIMPIHVVDHHWKTKLCSVLLLSNETRDVVLEGLTMFEQENEKVLQKLQFHVVDKDFVEIECASSVFQNSQLILCQWHCKRAVDKKINELCLPPGHQHFKDELRSLFSKMLLCETEEEYLQAWLDMYTLSLHHESIKNFYAYMNKNWHQNSNSWATSHLKKIRLFQNFTNNRSENFNQQLKRIIKRQSSPDYVLKELINLDKFQTSESLKDDLNSTEKVFCPLTGNTQAKEVMESGSGWLAVKTLKKLLAQSEQCMDVPEELISTGEGQLSCSLKTGPCLFSSNNGLPCKHLFKARLINMEPLLVKEMVSEQWIIAQSEDINEESEFPKEDENTHTNRPTYIKKNTLARHSKHKKSAKVIKEIPEALAQFPEKEREAKMDILTQHMNMTLNAINNDMDVIFEENTIKFVKKEGKSTNNQRKEEEETDFIFSPKKRNRSYSSGGDASTQKRKRKDASSVRRKVALPLNDWQLRIIQFQKAAGSGSPFGLLEFEVLSDLSRSGFRAYLTDSHFHNFMILLHQAYPSLGSLQPTSLYEFTGFNNIDPSKDFLQPIHSGGSHWSLLSNIGLSDAEKASGCKILYFDSLIHMNESDTQAMIPNAALWQAAQLLKKEQKDNVQPIEIVAMPAEQQNNGHDCGLFTLANMMALATGLNPSEIVYKPGMRTQLLDMFKANKVWMFDYEERNDNGPNRSKFTVSSGGRLKKTILLRPFATVFETVCFCQHPRSWDNIIICDACQNEFHQRCVLIGPSIRGPGIAEALQTFVCFDCRKAGHYECGFSHMEPIDKSAIDAVAAKIEKLDSANLASLYGIIINHKRSIPSRLADYRMLEGFYQKYDLNAVCENRGPIYVSMRNFYTMHARDLDKPKEFKHLNQGQKIYLALLLICKASNQDLPPVHISKKMLQCDEDLTNVIKVNKAWLHKLELTCQELCDLMKKLKKLPKSIATARDYEAYLTRELTDLETSADAIHESLYSANEAKATEKEKIWKQETMDKCLAIKQQAAMTTDELDEFLRHALSSNKRMT